MKFERGDLVYLMSSEDGIDGTPNLELGIGLVIGHSKDVIDTLCLDRPVVVRPPYARITWLKWEINDIIDEQRLTHATELQEVTR